MSCHSEISPVRVIKEVLMKSQAYIVFGGEISPNVLDDKVTFQILGETSEVLM